MIQEVKVDEESYHPHYEAKMVFSTNIMSQDF